MRKAFGMGQFVIDLPVSTEVSVKGGKGIWGMPKHQANLDFVVTDRTVSSQYDLDGKLCMRIEMDRPAARWLPLSMGAANYFAFRGLLMKSYVYFRGKVGITFWKKGAARLTIGDHPRVQPLRKELGIGSKAIHRLLSRVATGCWTTTSNVGSSRRRSSPITRRRGWRAWSTSL